MAASLCAGWGSTKVPDSGDDTTLWVVAPALHHRVYKRTCHGATRVLFLLAAPVCSFLSARPGLVVVFPVLRSRLLVDFSSSSSSSSRSSSSSSASSCRRSCSSFLSARSVWLGIDSLPIRRLAPPFFTNSPADSAFSTASSPFYAPELLTPPKVRPSRLTVVLHSLDRHLAARSAVVFLLFIGVCVCVCVCVCVMAPVLA